MTVSERNMYLENIPVEDAQARLLQALQEAGRADPLPGESVTLRDARGRITAEAVRAKLSAPHYNASAMDGYAVQAADTQGATETRPVTLAPEQFDAMNTGAPLPDNRNAVIMVEHVQEHDDGITIIAPVAPYQHVRMMGEDMVATELVLPTNHKIRPVDIGAIAGSGHSRVNVRQKPHVVIMPTGSELVAADTEPEAGQLIEFNSLVLGAQIEDAGGTVTILPIQPDDTDTLEAAFDEAMSHAPDCLLILSGSSAGSKDFTSQVIQQKGTLLVHGIAARPGHPVIIGMVDATPVIGVPGYPVSAALTGELFIEPLLARWLGQTPHIESRPRLTAQVTRKITSPTGDDDYVRVAVANVGGKWLATPLSRGAGVITSLVRADGLAHIPRFSEGLDMNAEAEILLYRTPYEMQRTLLITGSHDPMLDLLAQYLAMQHPGSRLASANVGSMGGLVALRRNAAHLAGMHLLDGDSGTYNIPYIEKQLRNQPVSVITFAHREQGLIVPPGNPERIESIQDVARVRIVNRQRGAGTRLLLDYLLEQNGIAADDIAGYQREEYTHLAVAAAVSTGIADCGPGVRRAADVLGLDFVSLEWERFDLVIPSQHMHHPQMQQLLATLRSEAFKDALAAQSGYDTRETGTVQYTSSDVHADSEEPSP